MPLRRLTHDDSNDRSGAKSNRKSRRIDYDVVAVTSVAQLKLVQPIGSQKASTEKEAIVVAYLPDDITEGVCCTVAGPYRGRGSSRQPGDL